MKVAVVGAGLIGRAWAIVFSRAGFAVSLWDLDHRAVDAALDFARRRLPELFQVGLLGTADPAAVAARMSGAATLEDALEGADLVQENGPERLAEKQALFETLDRVAAPEMILASSSSAIRASLFTEALPGRARCLIAHPVNPPYLIPVVEICPAPWTDPEVVRRTQDIMRAAGMVPATLKREIRGFLLNRLQAALLSEAFRLVEDGVADPEDIEATVKHGLGLRWSFMGPFETIDLNAPDGLADYCGRYAESLAAMVSESAPTSWSAELVGRLDAARREMVAMDDHAERQEWRDRRLMALLAHKAGQTE
jgi:3-hydroxyacyl-CoA dehydrogenase